jgi:hypothetical protein
VKGSEPVSAGRSALGFSGQLALAEIDLFPAGFTLVGTIKLIGEDFDFVAALWAFADEGFQVTEIFKSRAVLGCRHDDLLFRSIGVWNRCETIPWSA